MADAAGIERIPVPLGDRAYDIVIGDGILHRVPDLLARACPASSYTILTDSTVAAIHGRSLLDALAGAGPCRLFEFPAGEWNKTRETWSALTDAMLRAGVTRDSAVLALGGGVPGDLAGFVAATYHRGIPYAQVPTTLLAMIDSSIGGKTGVDTAFGKNLVGAFHQPAVVVADVATLKTLPKHQMAAGAAEALKHGALADRDYFEEIQRERDAILQADPAVLTRVVRRSIDIKASVVADDEREAGRRAILNVGHTVAHAIEATGGYALLHGEAVAVGMVAEARIGEAVGVTAPGTAAALGRALEQFDLPLEVPSDPPLDDMLDAMRQDKKSRDAAPRFAFLREIGRPARTNTGDWTTEAPEDVIRTVLAGMR